MPIKMNESFNRKVPELPINDKAKDPSGVPYNPVSASSKSTTRAAPIGAYIQDNISELVELADNALRSAIQLDEYMPGIEKTYLLANEADVVRASGQHLVYPINMLLPELFPGIATELKIICNSEVSENQESRFDMRWLLCRPGSGKPDVTVVILEYKTTRVLHRRDFEVGKCNEENAGEMMREASKRRNKTNFDRNAVPVSLQASKYSTICKDIAVFDWSAMMLFDLNSWDPRDGLAPRGVFYEESQKEGNFRKVLLGFLLRALSRHL